MEYKQALHRLMAVVAYTEEETGKSIATLLAKDFPSHVLQHFEHARKEEAEHAAMMYGLLKKEGISYNTARELVFTTTNCHSLEAPAAIGRAKTLAEALVLLYGVDAGGNLHTKNYLLSNHLPWRKVAAHIIADEEGHESFAKEEITNLVLQGKNAEIQEALITAWPVILNFFGPGSKTTELFVGYGLKARDNIALKNDFIHNAQWLDALGLFVPLTTLSYPYVEVYDATGNPVLRRVPESNGIL